MPGTTYHHILHDFPAGVWRRQVRRVQYFRRLTEQPSRARAAAKPVPVCRSLVPLCRSQNACRKSPFRSAIEGSRPQLRLIHRMERHPSVCPSPVVVNLDRLFEGCALNGVVRVQHRKRRLCATRPRTTRVGSRTVARSLKVRNSGHGAIHDPAYGLSTSANLGVAGGIEDLHGTI